MVDFVYPSVFGIGASVLFIVLMIACCVRWLRLYKLQHTNTVSAVSDGATSTTTPNTAPQGQLGYPPPYSIRMTHSPAVGPGIAPQPPGYYSGYYQYPAGTQPDGFIRVSGRSNESAAQGPMAIGVNSFNFATSAVDHVPAPPSYFDDRPPSYDDVVAAGKAVTVPKVQKDQSASDSGHGQNR